MGKSEPRFARVYVPPYLQVVSYGLLSNFNRWVLPSLPIKDAYGMSPALRSGRIFVAKNG